MKIKQKCLVEAVTRVPVSASTLIVHAVTEPSIRRDHGNDCVIDIYHCWYPCGSFLHLQLKLVSIVNKTHALCLRRLLCGSPVFYRVVPQMGGSQIWLMPGPQRFHPTLSVA